MVSPKPCRVCGGKVTQQHRINRHDWICPECNKAQLQRRRRSRHEYEAVEAMQQKLDTATVANGALRLRVYDLERSFRLAEEAGIELPDPDDYSDSGLDYEPERSRPEPVLGGGRAEGDDDEF